MIRPYFIEDKKALLHILELLTPQYFDVAEKADFIKYLKTEKEDYFVIELNNQVVGSGGVNYFHSEREARISWDLIHPDFQGKGLGKQLLAHRIYHIKNQNRFDKIIVRTSQMAFQFYLKMGFETITIEKDFWAQGFDLYFMELNIK